MTGPRTRRRFLVGFAAVSSVSLAGCNGLPWDDDTTSLQVPASEAETVLATHAPTFDFPAPIDPVPAALEAAVDRVDDLLADVPDPLEPDDVPNGEIRRSIADAHDDALAARDELADAVEGAGETDRYHALASAPDARSAARRTATPFAAIADDSLADPRREEPADVR